MIGELLAALPASRWGDRHALIDETGVVTWNELRQIADRLVVEYQGFARQRVAICLPCNAWGLASLAALDWLSCDVVLMDAMYSSEVAVGYVDRLRAAVSLQRCAPSGSPAWTATVGSCEALPASGDRTITLITSGTTGAPKAVRHTWGSLGRPVRSEAGHAVPSVWLLSYRPHLYAGIQVMLQALARGDVLAVPSDGASPNQIVHFMQLAHVDCVSATPSYWRQLLLFADQAVLKCVPLRQITLGGEMVDQHVLDQLRQLFPTARISHIYATSELGRCFSVRDGRAGFPASLLNTETPDGVQMQVVDGELHVRSRNSMLAYDTGEPTQVDRIPSQADQFFATGDLVEVVGDRVLFVGRKSDLINVGGNKVSPAVVEAAVRQVSGVLDVRVFAKPSSIAGQIVACQVVRDPEFDATELRGAIGQHCRKELLPAQVPRSIEFVAQIELSVSGKVPRGGQGAQS